ncbi:MAG: hypothetical protein ACREGJ_02555 [Candidatus Saccharimonadales bacterium]
MITATPAPKVKNTRLLVIVYAYALLVSVMALAQLMSFEEFIVVNASYLNIDQSDPWAAIATIRFIGIGVFAIPFLLRLPLSPLARWFSALFALTLPFFWLFTMGQAMLRGFSVANVGFFGDFLTQPLGWLTVFEGIALATLGVVSFLILRGPKAFRFQ